MLWMLLACGQTLTIEGTVDAERDGDPLANGRVTLRDGDGVVLDEVKTNANGVFSAKGPVGTNFFVEVSGDGLVPSTFTGLSGIEDPFRIEPGALYGVPDDQLADEEARFDGCPGLGSKSAVVGEIRFFDLADQQTGDKPVATSGFASVVANGNTYPACYLAHPDADDPDAPDPVYDPEADRTGGTGVFAIFGVPAGRHQLIVGYLLGDQERLRTYPIYVPKNGVAPWYPAWVTLVAE